MRPTGFEPATVGFGVQRSTVGATPSYVISSKYITIKNWSFILRDVHIKEYQIYFYYCPFSLINFFFDLMKTFLSLRDHLLLDLLKPCYNL